MYKANCKNCNKEITTIGPRNKAVEIAQLFKSARIKINFCDFINLVINII